MILKSTPEAQYIYKNILYRSSFYAVAGYFISLMIEKLVMMVGAVLNGYATGINYREVIINAVPAAWSQESVLTIFLLPYIILAVILVWLFLDLQKRLSHPAYMRIFTHWIIFFLAFRLLAMLPAHLYCKTGIYHAFNWLYLGWKIKILIGVAGLILFFLTGVRLLNLIFFLFGSYNNNSRVIGSQNILYASILVPSLACTVIPALFFLPHFPKDEIIGLMVLTLPFIYVFLRLTIMRPEFLKSRNWVEENYDPFRLCIILLIIIIILRILLGIGISLN
jgi:hypothetical protein